MEALVQIGKLLRGRLLVELQIARGVVLTILHPRAPQALLENPNLQTEQLPRLFYELVVYSPNPLIIGGWKD